MDGKEQETRTFPDRAARGLFFAPAAHRSGVTLAWRGIHLQSYLSGGSAGRQRLAVLYGVTLDELIDYDLDVQEIQEIIDRTSEELTEKIDWTKAWGKRYPILLRYQKEVDIPHYAAGLLKVTYADLMQLCLFIVALVGLCYTIFGGKK